MKLENLKIWLALLLPMLFMEGFSQIGARAEIDSITIENGKIRIDWKFQDTSAIDYVIHRQGFINNQIQFAPIDTVFYPDSVYIDNTGFDPCLKDSIYVVDAVFNLNSIEGWTASKVPFLAMPELELCFTRVSLNWTNYIVNSFNAIKRDVEKYQILAYINDSTVPILMVDDIPPDQTAYDNLEIEPNTKYSFFIRAIDSLSFTSTSCAKTLPVQQVILPEFLTLQNVTVDNSTKCNDLSWIADEADPPIKKFVIYRSSDGNSFDPIEEIENDTSNPVTTFTDFDVRVNEQSYYYKVIAYDLCDIPFVESDSSKTILLQGNAEPQVNNLMWDAFIGWQGKIKKYNIYRYFDENINTLIFLDSVPPNILSYSDALNDVKDVSSFSYYVEAVEDSDTLTRSRSNTITLKQETVLMMPNAFNPGSNIPDNQVFKPKYQFPPDKATFYMAIFNKWGEQIIETTDYEKGWDGKLAGGKDAPPDVYAYILRYRGIKGIIKELKGTVTLVR